MSIIDLTDNGFSYPATSAGDVLGFTNPEAGRMVGEVGDVVLWTTQAGVARGEVEGADYFDGIPVTLVRVA